MSLRHWNILGNTSHWPYFGLLTCILSLWEKSQRRSNSVVALLCFKSKLSCNYYLVFFLIHSKYTGKIKKNIITLVFTAHSHRILVIHDTAQFLAPVTPLNATEHCLPLWIWRRDEVHSSDTAEAADLWCPDVLRKARLIYFTHISQVSASYKYPCTNSFGLLLFEFHFLPSKKSHRGHFFREVLNTAQWTALHGFMPCRVILLGTNFKIRIFSRVLAAVNKAF